MHSVVWEKAADIVETLSAMGPPPGAPADAATADAVRTAGCFACAKRLIGQGARRARTERDARAARAARAYCGQCAAARAPAGGGAPCAAGGARARAPPRATRHAAAFPHAVTCLALP